jgi:hypothetical protein
MRATASLLSVPALIAASARAQQQPDATPTTAETDCSADPFLI